MRFGHWRGVMFAVALFFSMAAGRPVSADDFHTMPKEVLARDLNTGQPYFAPAIPWGHYAKDGLFDHFGKTCVLGKFCLGKNCRFCGGNGLFGGKCGHGLFNHCGKGSGDGCGDPGCGGHGRRIKDCGLCKGKGCGLCKSSRCGEPIHALASSQAPPPPPVMAAPQASPVASAQGQMTCDGCGGKGCGKCHGLGRLFGQGDPCDGCGGKGCGKCGGLGRLFGKGCGFCGGKGCAHCGLGSHMKGKIAGLFHHNKIKYFVGPGGPVPLTPGYTPYVVTTRSPRDFLAFPPYTPDGF